MELKSRYGSEGVNFDFTFMNNGSHFGEDEGFLWPYIILFVLWLAILVLKLFMHMLSALLKFNTSSSDVYLALGYLMIGFSFFYKLINIVTTLYAGEKIVFFDILHGVLKNLAEGVILTLLIAISWGWSMIHTNFQAKYKLIVIGTTLLNVTNVVLWHSMEEIEDTYHQYE